MKRGLRERKRNDETTQQGNQEKLSDQKRNGKWVR